MTTNCGVIILAAGSSSRLGRPKQLLPYRGKALLEQLVTEAQGSAAALTLVVLGANAEEIKKQLPLNTTVVTNTGWQEGMASSIRNGVQTIQEAYKDIDAIILMVCDQPFVTSTLINEIISEYQRTGKPVIASSYAGVTGPPALFDKRFFPELLQLKGDHGAKSVVQKHIHEMAVVSFPQGNTDIDTPGDYESLVGSTKE